MRIVRARLTLPARMKLTAAGDARQIAESVAQALAAHGGHGANFSIAVAANGRPARHLAFDLATATSRAVRAPGRGS